MVTILRIERAIDWLATALTANRDSNPIPEGFWSAVMPTVEIFGSQRAAEIQAAVVIGGLGGLEIVHSVVPAGRVRHYLAMEYLHFDGVNHRLVPGRTFTTDTGFPFVAMRDGIDVAAVETLAVRNFTVGPRSRAAAQTPAMGGGARMELRLVWVEFPLGETVRLE